MTKKAAGPACGAATRKCVSCGHHRKEHDKKTGKSSDARCRGFEARPCTNAPLKNRDRCKMHGGKSLVGPAHPNFQTGKHSILLRGKLAETYSAALNHPDLVSLREEIALVDTRVAQLLAEMGGTGNTKVLKEIRAKFDQFKAAGKKRGKTAAVEGLGTLETVDRLIDAAMTEAATWEELRETLDLRRKLTETETRRMRDLDLLMDVKTVSALMQLFVVEVKKRVKDPELLAALSSHLARAIGGGSSADVRPGT